MITFLGGNPWDWLIIFILLILAIAMGVKNGEDTVIPKEVIVRAFVVPIVIFILFNIPKIISLLT